MPDASQDNQSVSVAILVFNPRGEVLLGQRLGKVWHDYYALPGGRATIGAKSKDDADRELREETGLTGLGLICIGSIFDQQEGGTDLTHHFYVAKDCTQEAQTTEPEKCGGWQWFDPENLPEQIVPAHREAITKLYPKFKKICEPLFLETRSPNPLSA